jgi:hypothetical protein
MGWHDDLAPAENRVRPVQAACWYSWMMPVLVENTATGCDLGRSEVVSVGLIYRGLAVVLSLLALLAPYWSRIVPLAVTWAHMRVLVG